MRHTGLSVEGVVADATRIAVCFQNLMLVGRP